MWQYLAYIAETTIFLVAGIIIGNRVLISELIEWYDYLLNFGLYFCLHFIRGISILTFFPILKRMGYGLNLSQVGLLTYAGLRGAIALTLALTVANN